MQSLEETLPRKSKIFFLLFFLSILVSIGHTYYRLEILKDFHAFGEEEEIPRPADFYLGLFGRL
jgi:hypothetical protein